MYGIAFMHDTHAAILNYKYVHLFIINQSNSNIDLPPPPHL